MLRIRSAWIPSGAAGRRDAPQAVEMEKRGSGMEIDNRKKIPESHMEYLPGMEVLEKSDLMDRVLKAAAEYRPEYIPQRM